MTVGLGLASAGLVGILMPVVVSCAFGIWIGELQRMERAGRYLRAREVAWSRGIAEKADPTDPRYGFVLLWESLLVDETRSHGYPKNRLGGAASVGLFLALSTFSLLAGVAVAIGPGGIVANLPPDLSPATVFWVVGVWVVVFLTGNIVAFRKPVCELAASTATKTRENAARSRTAKARA